MKKVAIYTIVSDNYGNRLQNYALQKVLLEKGYQVETIRREGVSIRRILEGFAMPGKERARVKAFRKFNENISWSRDYISKDHIPADIADQYDMFFIGSDQIWNINFYFSSINDYLPFVPKAKKIAVAASFGIDKIPEQFEGAIAEGLKDLRAISVREDAGAAIVQRYAKRESAVLIDPTMLLDKQEWEKISVKPKIDTSQPYILTYFLGGSSKEQDEKIDAIAKQKKMPVYHLLDPKDELLYCAGPGEFVHLFSHASLVCTDSFHACVFSILFDKPFIAFSRIGSGKEMNSRIITLLTKFHLLNRLEEQQRGKDAFQYDYTECYAILKQERIKFRDFLEQAIIERMEK